MLLALLAGRDHRAAYRRAHGRPGARSADFPERVKRAAKFADRHRCVAHRLGGCAGGLELDHFCPWSAGGMSVLTNAMTLCRWHNRVKSDYWEYKSGHVRYHPFAGADNWRMAADILAAERRARLSPGRWLLLVLG